MASALAGLPSSILSIYLDYKNNRQPRFIRWLTMQVWQRKRQLEPVLAASASGAAGGSRKKKGQTGNRKGNTPAALQYKLKKPSPLPDPFPLSTPEARPRLNDLALLSEFLSNLDPSEKRSRGSHLSTQDLTHNHAIKVFEDVLAILRSCGTGADKEGTTEAAGRVVAVIHYFSLRGSEATGDWDETKSQAVLDEDPNEWISASHQLVAKKKLEKKKAEDPEPAEMPLSKFLLQEDDGFEDAQQAAFCFLLDAERLSQFVKQTWAEYASRSITLATATLVTNQALAFLKESERALLDQYKKFYTIGDHGEIVSVMMGERTALSVARLEQLLVVASTQGKSIDDLEDFLRVGLLKAFTQFGSTLTKETVPLYKENHFGRFDPSRDREKMSSHEQFREDLALVADKLGEVAIVASCSDPHLFLAEEALYVDTRRFIKDSQHPVPTHLLLQWDFWLQSVHACRKELMRPCSTALKTVHGIVEAAKQLRDEPRHSESFGAPSELEQVDQGVIKRLEWQYDPDTPVTTLVRRVFENQGQRERARKIPPFEDLRLSPWAAGCLQISALNIAHSTGLGVTNVSGYLSAALQLYHALRLHKKLESVPFLDALFSQCVPTIYGSSKPPEKGGLLKAHVRSLTGAGGGGRGYLPIHTGTSLIAEVLVDTERYSLSTSFRQRIIAKDATDAPQTGSRQRNPSDIFSLLAKLKILYERDLTTSTFAMDLFATQDLAVRIFERWYTLSAGLLREACGMSFIEKESQKPTMTSWLFSALEGGRDKLSPELVQDLLKQAAEAFGDGLKSFVSGGGALYYPSANDGN